jgi:hypothetical protein
MGLDGGPVMKFYMVIGGQRKGPFALEELPEHGLEHDTLVWHAGLSRWERADKLPALREMLLTIPPPLPELPPPLPSQEPGDATTPAGIRTLYLWWVGLLIATAVVPLLGGLSLLLAETQRDRYSYQWGYSYYYTPLGNALLVVGGVLLGAGSLPLVASVVLLCVLLYKVWDLIQDGHARTTPGTAVSLMFLPLFNLYWVFVAFYGLAQDLITYRRRHGRRDMPRTSPGLALAFCILFVCTFLPFVNFATTLPMLVVLFLVVTSFKNAALVLARTRRPAADFPAGDVNPTAFTERRPDPEAL